MTNAPSFRPPKDLGSSQTSHSAGEPGEAKTGNGCGAGCLVAIGIVVLIGVVFGLASCGSGSDSDSSYTPDQTSKYTQTWAKPYSGTTCDDWNSQLTSAQQFAASADMLAGARNRGNEGSGLPPDALIDEFSGGITTVCVEPTMALTDAAVGLYLTDPRFRP
jgi:hypothetical protein